MTIAKLNSHFSGLE